MQAGPGSAEPPTKACSSGAENCPVGTEVGRQGKGLSFTLPHGAPFGQSLGPGPCQVMAVLGFPSCSAARKFLQSQMAAICLPADLLICAAAIPEAAAADKIYMYISTAFALQIR